MNDFTIKSNGKPFLGKTYPQKTYVVLCDNSTAVPRTTRVHAIFADKDRAQRVAINLSYMGKLTSMGITILDLNYRVVEASYYE